MKLNNTNFRANKIKRFILAKSQSLIYIDIVTFTDNLASVAIVNTFEDSKLEICNAEFR